MRLPVETLKICPQVVGIKPKPHLKKFNDQKEENHKNLPCVEKNTSLLFPQHVMSHFWLQILYP